MSHQYAWKSAAIKQHFTTTLGALNDPRSTRQGPSSVARDPALISVRVCWSTAGRSSHVWRETDEIKILPTWTETGNEWVDVLWDYIFDPENGCAWESFPDGLHQAFVCIQYFDADHMFDATPAARVRVVTTDDEPDLDDVECRGCRRLMLENMSLRRQWTDTASMLGRSLVGGAENLSRLDDVQGKLIGRMKETMTWESPAAIRDRESRHMLVQLAQLQAVVQSAKEFAPSLASLTKFYIKHKSRPRPGAEYSVLQLTRLIIAAPLAAASFLSNNPEAVVEALFRYKIEAPPWLAHWLSENLEPETETAS